MQNRKIPKEQWQAFCDELSHRLKHEDLKLEIAGLEVGDQIQEERGPIMGLTYEARRDEMFVLSPSLEHQIVAPVEVLLEEDGDLLRSVTVQDRAGVLHTIRLRRAIDRAEEMQSYGQMLH